MGAYNELTDLEFCENNRRRSRSSGRIVQSLFSIPNWIVLAGGMAIGSMLGRSSSSASPVEEVNADVPMVESYSTEEIVSCGPWGGAGGTPFYDGRGDIVEILVTHNAERVLCIETSYNQGSTSFKAVPHGTGSAGAQSTQVTLQFPEEYVVQVKGTIDTWTTIQAPVVSSLTLVTNKKVYGPFGRESGTSFESLPGGRVVGFFGRSGTLLDQLGVLSHPSESFSTTSTNSVDVDVEETWVALDGPWGGADGSLFHDGHGRILEIVVTYHENHVNSLQVIYEYGATQFAGSVHGVPAGKESKISLHHLKEYLVKVKGTIGKISGHNTVTSLTFITNKHSFGPYGSPTGEAFESSPGREVTGFFGRCSSRLDQIGVITGTPGHSGTAAVQGPWGAEHGSQFCSGRGELTEIYITFTKAHLVALQTTYSLGSDMGNFKSDSWGGKSPAQIEKISLHSPEEYLIQVKGTIDVVNGKEAVTSLTFVTNQRTCGPYGSTSGKSFESTPAKIGGFFGRCESHIHQLGVITELSSNIQLRRMFTETIVDTRNSTDIGEHSLDQGMLVLNGEESNNHIDTAQKLEHSNNGIAHYLASRPSYVTKHLVSSDVLVIQQGPWGGSSGQEFYDGRGDIVDLNISYNDSLITSIQVGYEQGGTNFQAPLHGGKGTQHVEINMDSSTEHVLQVKGTSGLVDAAPAITSLTVVTNKATYGPYGSTQGKRFQSSREGMVVGLFGRASAALHQLGVITLINAAPSNGQCIRCATPYTYCCQCTVLHSPVSKPFGYENLTSVQITYPNFLNRVRQKPQQHYLVKPTSPTPEPIVPDEKLQPQTPSPFDEDQTAVAPKPDLGDRGKPQPPPMHGDPQPPPMHGDPKVPQPPVHGDPKVPHRELDGPGKAHPPLMHGDLKVPQQELDAPSKAHPPPVQRDLKVPQPPVHGDPKLPQQELDAPSKAHPPPVQRDPKVPQPPVHGDPKLPQQELDAPSKAHPPPVQRDLKVPQPPVHGDPKLPQQELDAPSKAHPPPVQRDLKVPQPPVHGDPKLPQQELDAPSKAHPPPVQRDLKVPQPPVHGDPKLPQQELDAPSKAHPPPVHRDPKVPQPPMHGDPKLPQQELDAPGKTHPPPVQRDPKVPQPPVHGDLQVPQLDLYGPGKPQLQPGDGLRDHKGSAQSTTVQGWFDWIRGSHVDNVSSVQGPWGLKAETNFYDGDGDISEIEVAYSKEFIVRIQTTYVLNGTTFKQSPQGGPGGDVAKVTLQYPDEYLIQVRGTTREVSSVGGAVTSLTFVTNNRTYGPYGSATGGSSFETTRHGRVISFYGRATSCVHSIGVLTAQVEDQPETETVIVQEAWGGQGGESFYEGGGEVTELLVSYSNRQVVSLQTTYRRGGKSFRTNQHGGQHGAGAKQAKITFNSPEEYLVQVKGSSYHINGLLVIESLEFVTNKQRYGPYGASNPQGQLRSTQKGGKVVGFFGKAGHFLDQLGVIVSLPLQRHDLVTCQGSWGGPGGSPFSDGRGEIVELLVKYNKKQIVSLQVTYEQGGSRYKSQLRGGVGNGESKQVSFGPGEYLVQMKGTTGGIVPGGTMVTSLTFITNRQTHGPFGAVTGSAFKTKASGKVVGVFGRSGSFLDSIGFITELRPGKALPATVKLGPWGGQGGREFCCGQGDVVKVVVYHSRSQINGLQVSYEQGGVSFEPVTYGGTSGTASEISVDFPDEHVTEVQGTTAKVGFLGSHQVITSLTFITNKHKYGPYGAVKGSEFGSPPSRLVTGFFGRAGDSLDQFGVFTTVDSETLYAYLQTYRVDWTTTSKHTWATTTSGPIESLDYAPLERKDSLEVLDSRSKEPSRKQPEPTVGGATVVQRGWVEEPVGVPRNPEQGEREWTSTTTTTTTSSVTGGSKGGEAPSDRTKLGDIPSAPGTLPVVEKKVPERKTVLDAPEGKPQPGDKIVEPVRVPSIVKGKPQQTNTTTSITESVTTGAVTDNKGGIKPKDSPSPPTASPLETVPSGRKKAPKDNESQQQPEPTVGGATVVQRGWVEEPVGVPRNPEQGEREWTSTTTTTTTSSVTGGSKGGEAPSDRTKLGDIPSAPGTLPVVEKKVPERKTVLDAPEGKPQPGDKIVEPVRVPSIVKGKPQQTNTTTSITESVTTGAVTDNKGGIKPKDSPSPPTASPLETVPSGRKKAPKDNESQQQPEPTVGGATVVQRGWVEEPVGVPRNPEQGEREWTSTTTTTTTSSVTGGSKGGEAPSDRTKLGDIPSAPGTLPVVEKKVPERKTVLDAPEGKPQPGDKIVEPVRVPSIVKGKPQQTNTTTSITESVTTGAVTDNKGGIKPKDSPSPPTASPLETVPSGRKKAPKDNESQQQPEPTVGGATVVQRGWVEEPVGVPRNPEQGEREWTSTTTTTTTSSVTGGSKGGEAPSDRTKLGDIPSAPGTLPVVEKKVPERKTVLDAPEGKPQPGDKIVEPVRVPSIVKGKPQQTNTTTSITESVTTGAVTDNKGGIKPKDSPSPPTASPLETVPSGRKKAPKDNESQQQPEPTVGGATVVQRGWVEEPVGVPRNPEQGEREWTSTTTTTTTSSVTGGSKGGEAPSDRTKLGDIPSAPGTLPVVEKKVPERKTVLDAPEGKPQPGDKIVEPVRVPSIVKGKPQQTNTTTSITESVTTGAVTDNKGGIKPKDSPSPPTASPLETVPSGRKKAPKDNESQQQPEPTVGGATVVQRGWVEEPVGVPRNPEQGEREWTSTTTTTTTSSVTGGSKGGEAPSDRTKLGDIPSAPGTLPVVEKKVPERKTVLDAPEGKPQPGDKIVEPVRVPSIVKGKPQQTNTTTSITESVTTGAVTDNKGGIKPKDSPSAQKTPPHVAQKTPQEEGTGKPQPPPVRGGPEVVQKTPPHVAQKTPQEVGTGKPQPPPVRGGPEVVQKTPPHVAQKTPQDEATGKPQPLPRDGPCDHEGSAQSTTEQGWVDLLPGSHVDNVSTVQGPWGLNAETNFYDGDGDISEIAVAYSKECILRIQTTYVLNGMSFKQSPQGGPGGDVAKVTLQYPDEYLVQVRGTTREVSSVGVAVTSLTFVTNKRTYGPYGFATGGSSFETTRHGRVMGFYGRATWCVHSIGVLTAQVEDQPDRETVIVQEAWGGQGGVSFYEGGGEVTELLVSYSDRQVVSLQTTYKRKGKSFRSNQHGGQHGVGSKQAKITLKSPEEYLVQVKGSSYHVNGLLVIESLEFVTNKQRYGPFGASNPQGQLRSTQKGGKVVGFFGKAGHFLDQLGVIVSLPWQRHDLVMCQGSWGGPGGSPFSDGRGEIVELMVKYDKKQIVSLQVTYEQGGSRYKSQLRGGVGNGKSTQVSFGPGEYLVQVKGTTGSIVPGGTMVTSLTFITNKQTHGPFGAVTGGAFETKASGKVVGVFGRSGSFLDSIGFITELRPGKALPATLKLGPWGGEGGHEFCCGQGDVVKVVVYHNRTQINGIQVTYEQGGVSFEPVTYGGTSGTASEISVNFPDEHVTQVQGTTAKVGFLGLHQVITSLTLITNKQKYGPYGAAKGSEFGSPASRLVTGFFGRAGDSLDQLGVFTTVDSETSSTYLHKYRVDWTTPSDKSKPLGLNDPGKPQPLPGHGNPKVPRPGQSPSGISSSSSSSGSDSSSSSRSSRTSKPSRGSASSESKSSSKYESSSSEVDFLPKEPSTPLFLEQSSDVESLSEEDGCSFTGSTKVEGPWGGDGGDVFYDGTGDVHEIRVAYSKKHVTSLQFLYISDGVVTEGTKIGGSPGDKFIKVVLKFPEEYIICIKGTFGVVSRHKIITSLTFVSNKGVYGPYGTTEGQEFTSSGSGKVVGIFGRAGPYIDQLGVFSTTVVTTSSSIEGSWGGDGGYVFSDGRGDIVEITVAYNRDQIVSFQAIYNQNGTRFPGRLHGGYGRKSESQTIVLNFLDEHLIQVQGTYGRVRALSNVITSLSFITSKKTYGPFGAVGGQEFKSSEGTRVVGFHGRSCDFLDRFGVFTTKERQRGLSRDAERDTRKVLAQGPWGGAGGSAFYDGRGDIVEILIEYTEDCIVSLQATYEQGGGVFKTTARFGPGGETAKIKFDQEQEQLLQIQGSIGDTFDTDMITSLTFITTKKIYGPYGTVTDKKFESKKHGKVVGFFGRSDEFLDQIGVVTEYSPKDYDVILSQGPWGGKNGTVFYDGKGSVVGIIVTYNQKQIISFQAIYNQGTAIFKADFHGGPGGKTAKIVFNSPSEELLQVKGTTGKVGGNLVVTSLTFCSNKRVFGPFGSVRNTKFESSPSGKVKGFYGKAGVCLDQIGFITQFSPQKLGGEVVVQGPWGGPSGSDFYGGRGEILDIMVCYSKTQILSLQMTYEHNGASYKGEKQGVDGGDLIKIPLKETDSYLAQVKGTFGKVAGTICITSLTFVTSKHTYGPFGSARGTHFQSYKSGKIVGVFGKASTSIDQLGVITQFCAESQVPRVQMKNMGPWGGQGGVEFHDGHGHIRDIDVHYTNHQVVAFQAIYEQGGIVLHGTNHGGTSKASRHVHHAKISFHGLDEYLIQITGTYGLVSGGKMITSLAFITNKQKYGPFGHEAGESFGTPSGQKIMGFFGRAAAYLDQVGVVVIEEPLHQPPAISPKSPELGETEEKVHVEGPWGVDQGTNFYGGRGNIVEIDVAFNKDAILRIQTTFQENGTNFKQEALGGPGGEVAKITLQYPDEYLVQVKGTTREVSSVGVAVTTLTFVTNKRSYGPYGSVTGGLSFETTQHGRVMGFYGKATSCLHSIGVLAEVEDLPDTETVVVQDAWGGQGGEPFFDGRGDVTEVLVTYNDLHVVSLQITYRHGGKIFKAKQHGGQKGVGAGQAKITLNYPEEYLMQVRGSSHNIDGALIMESLDFITNKRSYGPYGALKPQGQLRTTPKNGKIVGFFGKAGYFLDQLGVIITFPSQRDDLLICQGSWGGLGGSPFCDGRGEIVELHVKYNKKQIISLQVTYEQGGVQYKSQLHGGGDGGESEKISFGPGEYLVQVKGTTGIIVPGGTMVTSLTIVTNKQLHGPFGAVAGCAFETKASGKVVGLFGRSARFLDSIGFITELHPGKALPATVKLGPWGGQGGREFYGGQGDIVKVVVYHNKHHISGIQTTYEQGGVSFEPVTFGNTNGHASEISLDFPNEYLAQVKGTTAKVGSHQVITSLAFITNKQKYGSYGHKKGSDFKSPSKRLVTGFFGQAGDALDQFGIFATASSGATDRYLRVHLDGWKSSWGAFIIREVSSAGKFFKEEFGKLPSIGHSHSQRGELGSQRGELSSPKGELGSEKGESGRHSFRLSLSENLKQWRV